MAHQPVVVQRVNNWNAALGEQAHDVRRQARQVVDVRDVRLEFGEQASGDPIDRVLRMIGLQLGADVERRGDSAIVRPSTRSVRPQ